MTTKRYVLFNRARTGKVAEAELSGIASVARVVDSIGSRAYLVEVRDDLVETLKQRLPGWTVEEERVHGHPRGDEK
jgi:hypothetical protein